jgi:hypothetical protein
MLLHAQYTVRDVLHHHVALCVYCCTAAEHMTGLACGIHSVEKTVLVYNSALVKFSICTASVYEST